MSKGGAEWRDISYTQRLWRRKDASGIQHGACGERADSGRCASSVSVPGGDVTTVTGRAVAAPGAMIVPAAASDGAVAVGAAVVGATVAPALPRMPCIAELERRASALVRGALRGSGLLAGSHFSALASRDLRWSGDTGCPTAAAAAAAAA